MSSGGGGAAYPPPKGEAAVILGRGWLFEDQIGTALITRRAKDVELFKAFSFNHLERGVERRHFKNQED